MKKRIRQWLKKGSLLPERKWPKPSYDNADQPLFLFVLTPPYSGSTALAELITSSQNVMSYTAKSEGQWLVPGMCAADRWDPNKAVNYASVKAVWLNAYQKAQRQEPKIEVVIEKSPPNIVRLEALAAQFTNVAYLANNRDPYANCASILSRHHSETVDQSNRTTTVEKVVQDWITRSTIIRKFVNEKKMPLITYEEMCEAPTSLLSKLPLPSAILATIDVNAKVKVKDYPEQPISNQNERQIAKLSPGDLDAISQTLKGQEDLMAFFGYSLR